METITKWIIVLFAVLLVAIALITYPVSAQTLPRPVSVKIFTGATNLEVELKDVILNIAVIRTTNEWGEIIEDANVIFPSFRNTDIIRATVLVCSGSGICVQSNPLGDAVYFEFDLTSLMPTTISTTIETTTTVPQTITTTIPETTTTLPEECPTCPTDYTDAILTGVLVLIFASAGGFVLIKKYFLIFVKDGWGVRIYKSQDGQTIQVNHKHPGIKNYHSPETIHSKSEVRHSKGKVF